MFQKKSIFELNFHKTVLFFSFIIYTITAYNSNGFYHADEHYQIIEFSGIKTGTHSMNDLTWEFKEAIRPTLQPTLCYLLFSTLNKVGTTDPYTKTFILRLISGLISLIIIRFFVEQTKNKIEEKYVKIYYLLSYLLWFIPFLSVRFSSETWSGLMLILSLAFYFKQQKESTKPIFIGIALGLSFLFRFQSVFFILPILIWLLTIEKKSILYLLKISFSIFLIFFIGILNDIWFYDRFVFTSYNYFYQNIILDVASSFGKESWDYYFLQLKKLPSIYIGIPLILAISFLLIKTPKNIFIWCIISYVFFHSLIPHKEERFLFPLAFLFPIILISAYQEITNYFNNRKTIILILNYLLGIVFISINGLGLIVMSQKSGGLGRMEITKFIHEKYSDKPIHLITCNYSNPYNPWGLPMKFYTDKNIIRTSQLNSISNINDSILSGEVKNLIVIRKIDLNNSESLNTLKKYNFKLIKKSIPDWIEKINTYYKCMNNNDVYLVYSNQ